MTSKECLKRIYERNYLTEREHKEFLNIIKQDLDRLEKLEKVIEWLKNTFEITLDSKLRISDEIDCVQAFPIDIDKGVVVYDLLKEVIINEKI